MIDIDAIDLDFAEPIELDFAEAAFVAAFDATRARLEASRAEQLVADKLAQFAPKPGPSAPLGFALREYQHDCLKAIAEGWKAGLTRLLAVLATGCGKTIIFSQVTAREVAAGGRVLIIAHTEELLEQAATKLERSTGVTSEREKAEHHADLNARVVIASVQTLARDARLTAFPDNHFTLVIIDEAHRSLAASYQKVINYFHYGAESLGEGWKAPGPGETYTHKARILGVTATPDRGDKRSLGEVFQGPKDEHGATKPIFDYDLVRACLDGYLVRPTWVQIPLTIDMKGVRSTRTANGSDFDVSELTKRITPFLRQIARHIVKEASDRKVVCFMPGVETARLLSEALTDEGMESKFVSGACPDRSDKLEWYNGVGAGHAICNAMLLTEGWDCPDVSAVCVLRPTKIRALYVQCVGRGTRILPGVIDGLTTRDERIRAIKASAKPDLKILDFLFSDLELVKPIDLVATTPQQKAQMEKSAGGAQADLLELAEAADRDLLKSLEEAAKRNSKKKARVIDPLAWAVSVGDSAIKDYVAETPREAAKPTRGQLELLERHKIDTSKVACFGQASKLIDRMVTRHKMGLCTIAQLNFMQRLGIFEEGSYLLSVDEATKLIDATLASKKSARDAAKQCPETN